ncbi:uncharacterized protein LOC142340691 [Convolutriloba macropyga]|uniref:uncharacterized protein LOC142340691 n=1 Tax=Convolutriloba macropyga TaxID=536237 RepID=UPI003F520B83
MRWCVYSFGEFEKCEKLSNMIQATYFYWHFRLRCILHTAPDALRGCFAAIASGSADLVSSDPALAYSSMDDRLQLEPLAMVQNGHFNASDYVIIITKRNSGLTLYDFTRDQISSMCLPPVGSAPYLFFVHYLNTLAKFTTQQTRPKPNKLANKTNISENSTNLQRPSPSPRRPCVHLTQLKKHAQFACIPGFTDYYQDPEQEKSEKKWIYDQSGTGQFGSGGSPGGKRGGVGDTLASRYCGLCATATNNLCEANHDNFFYGNAGALRCMHEHYPDIAVTTWTVLFDNTNMNIFTEWNWNYRRALFHLLCPLCSNITHVEAYRYKECNLGEIPSPVVMTRRNVSDQVRSVMFHFLKALDSVYTQKGWETKPWFNSVFRSGTHSDLMFPNSGRNIIPLPRNYSFQEYPQFVSIVSKFVKYNISEYQTCGSLNSLPSNLFTILFVCKLMFV